MSVVVEDANKMPYFIDVLKTVTVRLGQVSNYNLPAYKDDDNQAVTMTIYSPNPISYGFISHDNSSGINIIKSMPTKIEEIGELEIILTLDDTFDKVDFSMKVIVQEANRPP
jgi:hypothetical protein